MRSKHRTVCLLSGSPNCLHKRRKSGDSRPRIWRWLDRCSLLKSAAMAFRVKCSTFALRDPDDLRMDLDGLFWPNDVSSSGYKFQVASDEPKMRLGKLRRNIQIDK